MNLFFTVSRRKLLSSSYSTVINNFEFTGLNKVPDPKNLVCNFIPFCVPPCFPKRLFSNFNSSKLLFPIKEQFEREIIYTEDEKSEVEQLLHDKYFAKAVIAFKLYSVTRALVGGYLKVRIMQFKKLLVLVDSFIKNSLIGEVNEINSKFIIFFYYLTKFNVSYSQNTNLFYKKIILRNLFFLFIFSIERLKFFNSLKFGGLFFSLPLKVSQKKKKNQTYFSVAQSNFVYTGVIPLIFYSPYKVSYFSTSNTFLRRFLVKRSNLVKSFNSLRGLSYNNFFKNKFLLVNILKRLRIFLLLKKLKRKLLKRVGYNSFSFKKCLSFRTFLTSTYSSNVLSSFKKSNLKNFPIKFNQSYLKRRFKSFFPILLRSFSLNKRFIFGKRKRRVLFREKYKPLLLKRFLLKARRSFFVAGEFVRFQFPLKKLSIYGKIRKNIDSVYTRFLKFSTSNIQKLALVRKKRLKRFFFTRNC